MHEIKQTMFWRGRGERDVSGSGKKIYRACLEARECLEYPFGERPTFEQSELGLVLLEV